MTSLDIGTRFSYSFHSLINFIMFARLYLLGMCCNYIGYVKSGKWWYFSGWPPFLPPKLNHHFLKSKWLLFTTSFAHKSFQQIHYAQSLCWNYIAYVESGSFKIAAIFSSFSFLEKILRQLPLWSDRISHG